MPIFVAKLVVHSGNDLIESGSVLRLRDPRELDVLGNVIEDCSNAILELTAPDDPIATGISPWSGEVADHTRLDERSVRRTRRDLVRAELAEHA
jgi:hypothetical protein